MLTGVIIRLLNEREAIEFHPLHFPTRYCDSSRNFKPIPADSNPLLAKDTEIWDTMVWLQRLITPYDCGLDAINTWHTYRALCLEAGWRGLSKPAKGCLFVGPDCQNAYDKERRAGISAALTQSLQGVVATPPTPIPL